MKHSKQDILDISIRLFATKGYESTTITDIISEANISKGGLYHYFSSKEDIANTVIDTYMAAIVDYYHANAEGKSPREKLLLFTQSKEVFSNDTIAAVEGMFYDTTQLTLRAKMKEQTHTVLKPVFVEMLREGIAAQSFKENDPEVMADYLFGMKDMFYSLPVETLRNPKKMNKYVHTYFDLMQELIGVEKDFFDRSLYENA